MLYKKKDLGVGGAEGSRRDRNAVRHLNNKDAGESKSPSEPLTEQRVRLRDAGFAPIPVTGKKPAVPQWQQKTNASDAEIETWRPYKGTGLLTRLMPALDIDIYNPKAVKAVEEWVRRRFKGRGTVLVRVGLAPKCAIPFRTGKPFKKITATLIPPEDDPTAPCRMRGDCLRPMDQKIELLCDGQQLVAFGIHPDTRKPYQWFGGEPGEVRHDELPEITEVEAQRLVDDVAQLLCDAFGYTRRRRTATRPQDATWAPNDKLVADDIAELAAAVDVIRNDIPGWENWNRLMMAIWAATGGSEEGFKIADRWCAKWKGYDAKDTRQRWEAISKSPPNRIGAGTIFHLAGKASPGWRATLKSAQRPQPLKPVRPEDFVAYLPAHNYIFLPTREPWPASSVDSQIPPVRELDKNGNALVDKKGKPIQTPAHTWLDKHRPVEQMTWAPGLPELIRDKLVADGGWIDRPGATCLNLYRPPTIKCGNAAEAKPWCDLVERVYPDNHRHLVQFFAHRVQQPGVKINHCLVLGGVPGIGKDTILEPVKRAIGSWNFAEVGPGDLFNPFNGYLKSVILRISEARDLGDVNRSFYEHTKTLMAAPPDVLRCKEKFLREHSVFNVTGVIIATNHKTDGIYLPEDDRRHYVAWSPVTKESFPNDFWQNHWRWYENGGLEHVAAYLHGYDLTGFDPKAPPPKTKAFWDIVDANRAPEESEMADTLDKVGNPPATTLAEIAEAAPTGFQYWLEERKNRRAIPHRLEKCGYVALSSTTKDHLWVIGGKRQVIYVRTDLPPADQIKAAEALVKSGPKSPPPVHNIKPIK
jgi:Primase C terminal 2 (PriCT-2)/Bifunctional DNA primase/polymerase, N-terminal/Family of unknown function (DUF5906)